MSRELLLALSERPAAKVLAFKLQEIERHKDRPPAWEEDFVEVGFAVLVEADDLPIEDGGVHSNGVRHRLAQERPGFECVASARDERAAVAVDDCECQKAIPLQLSQPVAMIKRLGNAHQAHRPKLQGVGSV